MPTPTSFSAYSGSAAPCRASVTLYVCRLCMAVKTMFPPPPVQSAIHTAAAMKAGTAELKKQMQLVSLDDIEDNVDDMADLLEDSNEINQVLPLPCASIIPGLLA